jgi:flagellar basal body-associated protein FliL
MSGNAEKKESLSFVLRVLLLMFLIGMGIGAVIYYVYWFFAGGSGI